MCLAENVLRIPDQHTARRLIADTIKFANWASHAGRTDSLWVNASTWGLLPGTKLVGVEREFAADPRNWLTRLTNRLSEPVVEKAMRSAMRILGREFVFGTTVEGAITSADKDGVYSCDILGEAARDQATAARTR